MCWRQVSKFQKNLIYVIFYTIFYLLISYAIRPPQNTTFVSDDLRVGDKYALMFLEAPQAPVFSDIDGTDVFKARHCGLRCFITNNKGFLPMREYDAILMVGEKNMFSETLAVMDPEKRYLMESRHKCIRNKLRDCHREPVITSFASNKSFDLCDLCEELHKKKQLKDT